MLPTGTFVVGKHLYAHCAECERVVRMTGLMRGWHWCLTDKEIAANHARFPQVPLPLADEHGHFS
jgi:hypothetical protein